MSFKTYTKVPKWARFLTFDEFQFFLATVRDELQTRRYLHQDNGDGKLDVVNLEGKVTRCNIGSLAVKCGAVGTSDYASEVRGYFRRIFGEMAPPPPFPESFEDVRSSMRVRIYRREHLIGGPDNQVSRPLAGDLVSLLVYEFPDFVVSVPPNHLETWKVSQDEALDAGVENIGKQKMRREQFSLGQAECFTLTGEHGWAASHILHIDRYHSSSTFGALVGLPNRHILICYPIDRTTVFEAMRELVPFVTDLYDDTPGGDERQKLSTNLHWCHGGRIDCIPAGMDFPGLPGSFVMPPEEFMEAVLSQATPPQVTTPKSGLS